MKKFIVLLISSLLVMGIFYLSFNNAKEPEKEVIVEEEVVEEVVIEEYKPEYKKPNYNEYNSELNKIINDNDVYGMQVVVFKGEDILDSYYYGYSDIDNKTAVSNKTVFRIASTSKMISNMLIMKLVDEGKISLDSKLKDVTGLNFDKDVELYHILTHTSGLGDSTEFNQNMNKVLDINHLLDISKLDKPGKTYNYTNFGAGTMAAIIEQITGEYFMDYAQENLFDYLDLNAGYVCEYLKPETTIAKMYDNGVIDPATWFFNYDFYRSFELGKQYRLAYGNMYISGEDLAKLGMVLAGDGTYKDKSVLSQNALKEIQTIKDEAKGQNYKMCLNTDYFDNLVEGRTLYGHTGSAYNAISCLIYDPSDNTGIAILTNHSLNRKNDLGYTNLIYDTVNLAYKEFFTKEGK